MKDTAPTPRVCLVGHPGKPDVPRVLDRIRTWLTQRGVQVSAQSDGKIAADTAQAHDLVIVLGGDGMILNTAGMLGPHQIPIVGVNLGKLGYMAEFSVDDFERHGERVLSDPSLVIQRMILDVEITVAGAPVHHRYAFNDCVVHSGPPFRMIDLGVRLDGQDVTHFTGDGLILATPTGSTAHNLSAGGPILQPDVEGAILTPICPHSLTHRPMVVGPNATIEITALRSNEGTTAVIDGQYTTPLPVGGRVAARRANQTFKLVRNPDRPPWKTLTDKLSWGKPPGR